MATKNPEPVAPAEAPAMTPHQALGVLDQVCSQAPLTRQDHHAVATAVQTLLDLIGPES